MIFKIPKIQMATALAIISAGAIVRFFSFEIFLRLFLILGFALFLEYLFWKIRRVEPFLPSAAVISALIIFLLADKNSPIELVLVAVFIAVALKQMLRPGGNHIFNPAASGLFGAGLVGLPISWWGVNWGTIPLITTIILAGFVSLYTIRQQNIVLPFILISFLASTVFLGEMQAAVRQMLVGSFWFFTLVMLPEPMTAAHFPNTRLLYGALVAILPFLTLESGFPDPLIASLLIGNLAARVFESFKL